MGNLKIKSSNWTTVFDWDEKEKEIKKIEEDSQQVGFWDNPQDAGKITKKLEGLKKEIENWSKIKGELNDIKELMEDIKEEDDETLNFIEKTVLSFQKKISEYENQTLLSGKYDRNDAIISIHAGAGGVDAQDWSEMLLRMYLKYFEKNGFEAKILQESRGGEAGIKSVTIEVEGEYAYGKMMAEKGVHRLVRLSPFNSDNLRQTSFAMVEVLPVLDEKDQVKIDDKDLRVDTFRSSGAGGQSVNTTDSAVRVTHVPTGIVASCQSERSQQQNKEQAMKILKSKLADYFENQRQDKQKELKGERQSMEWGSQIRSYVLHPYKLVKDHRTGYETAQIEDVLEGDVENFIEEELKRKNL